MATPRPKANFDNFAEMLNFSSPAPELEVVADTAPAPVQGGIVEMDFADMQSFPEHKFKLYEGQQLTDMVESIKQFGVLLPIILWHTEDGRYIILSGHNRRNAAQLAGLTKGPIIIKENITHEDAVLIVTETNLRQRSFGDMCHSERAYCLAQHYEALKSQGKRSDLILEIEQLLNPHGNEENSTSPQVGAKLRTDEKIGQDYALSKNSVSRYIRIASLISSLLEKVDTGEIAFMAAYDLTFIEDSNKQQQIVELMESDNYKLDMKKAELLRSHFESNKLTDTTLVQILSGEKTRKPKSDKPKPMQIKPAVISKYFTKEQSQKEIEDTIDKALALYFENQNQDMEVIT